MEQTKSLKQKAVSTSLWTLLGFGVSQVIRLGGNLILTRLLVPEMFGLMTVVTAVRVGVYMCSEIGLRVSVIRDKRGEDSTFINTAWSIQIIRGFFLWLLIIIIAGCLFLAELNGWISNESIYADPLLPTILIISGITAFINGFSSTGVWLAQRNMQLGRVTLLELIAQLLSITVMILGAYWYQNIWPLVIGNIVASLMRTILSHALLKSKKHHFHLDKKITPELLSFGKWMLLSAIFTFTAQHGGKLILAAYLKPATLGVYVIAAGFASAITGVILKFNTNLWFPLLSDINRNQNKRLCKVYYKIRMRQDALIYSILGFIFFLSPLIIDILYDERYKEAGWMLQIILLSIISLSYNAIGTSCINIIGKPHLNTLRVAIKAIALCAGSAYIHKQFGSIGLIWFISLISFIDIPILIIIMKKNNIFIWYKEIIFLPLLFVSYWLGTQLLKLLIVFSPNLTIYQL